MQKTNLSPFILKSKAELSESDLSKINKIRLFLLKSFHPEINKDKNTNKIFSKLKKNFYEFNILKINELLEKEIKKNNEIIKKNNDIKIEYYNILKNINYSINNGDIKNFSLPVFNDYMLEKTIEMKTDKDLFIKSVFNKAFEIYIEEKNKLCNYYRNYYYDGKLFLNFVLSLKKEDKDYLINNHIDILSNAINDIYNNAKTEEDKNFIKKSVKDINYSNLGYFLSKIFSSIDSYAFIEFYSNQYDNIKLDLDFV